MGLFFRKEKSNEFEELNKNFCPHPEWIFIFEDKESRIYECVECKRKKSVLKYPSQNPLEDDVKRNVIDHIFNFPAEMEEMKRNFRKINDSIEMYNFEELDGISTNDDGKTKFIDTLKYDIVVNIPHKKIGDAIKILKRRYKAHQNYKISSVTENTIILNHKKIEGFQEAIELRKNKEKILLVLELGYFNLRQDEEGISLDDEELEDFNRKNKTILKEIKRELESNVG